MAFLNETGLSYLWENKLKTNFTKLDSRLFLLEHMVIQNDITCPILLSTSTAGNPVLLVDSDSKAILANWKYKEG